MRIRIGPIVIAAALLGGGALLLALGPGVYSWMAIGSRGPPTFEPGGRTGVDRGRVFRLTDHTGVRSLADRGSRNALGYVTMRTML